MESSPFTPSPSLPPKNRRALTSPGYERKGTLSLSLFLSGPSTACDREMHRSGSTSRASDEFFANTPPPPMGRGLSPGPRSTAEMDHLPLYNPQSEFAKKEVARARSAEGAVHVIPVILIVCAMVLWFFSSPQIDVVSSKGDSILARIENMTIDGYTNDTSSSIGQDDFNMVEQSTGEEAAERMLMNEGPE